MCFNFFYIYKKLKHNKMNECYYLIGRKDVYFIGDNQKLINIIESNIINEPMINFYDEQKQASVFYRGDLLDLTFLHVDFPIINKITFIKAIPDQYFQLARFIAINRVVVLFIKVDGCVDEFNITNFNLIK